MNEQLQQALTELIEKSMAVAGDPLAFAQEELPDVIQQLLMWKAVESFAFMLVWLSMLFGIKALISGLKKMEGRELSYSEKEAAQGFAVAGIVGLGMALLVVTLVCGVPDWIQILVAPKVYLIEYAANIAK